MKSRYQSKYSAYSPNYEPMTPYGEMRKRMSQNGQKQKRVYSYGSQKGIKDVYQVNNEILQDMQLLHDKQLLCKTEGEKVSILLQLKRGLEKMQKKAGTIDLDEDTKIEGESEDDKIKKQIVSDLVTARSLTVTLDKFG